MMLKPYRFISTRELKYLEDLLQKRIEAWNQGYSLHPLRLSLSVPHLWKELLHIESQGNAIAAVAPDYLHFINSLLFDSDSPSFHSASKALFLCLVQEVLKDSDCQIEDKTDSTASWIYKGSTCLVLTLFYCDQQLTCYLHPDWVYHNLPSSERKIKALIPLEKALEQQSIVLNLELNPLTLPLHQLLHLKVGEVLLSDHCIQAPLQVLQNKQQVALAELGQSQQFKSITLKRSL